MRFLNLKRNNKIAMITLSRGKVNAVNNETVIEFSRLFVELEKDESVKGVVLTGQGNFFSFGFDVPELYDYSPAEFTRFLQSFCQMYKDIFLFPKPMVVAINGHAVAGGCILALMADFRVIAGNKAKMSLNEVTFGAALFAGAVEMLRFAAGNKTASEVLLSGQMFNPQEALKMGLVDQLTSEDQLLLSAEKKAVAMGQYYGPNFAALKRLLRQPIAEEWSRREENSIVEFVQIWYSPETREKTKGIKIYI